MGTPRDKRAWRLEASAARRDLPVDSEAYRSVLDGFLRAQVPPDRHILLYLAMPGEVDLAPLAAASSDPVHRFAVTRTPQNGHALTVHPLGVPMERHRYGFQQPMAGAPTLADDEVGAVLVPGLAFDRVGTRLGRGKGYYDRLLARMSDGTLFIGITGDYIVERLPAEPYDVPMTHLATAGWVRSIPLGD